MMSKKRIFIALLFLSALCLSIIQPSLDSIVLSHDKEQNIEINNPKISSTSGGGYIMNTCAPFNWIEIKDTGTLMAISNLNDAYQELNITDKDGWKFEFYETEYDNISISTNGWMSFGDLGYTNYWLDNIPDCEDENVDAVALFCEDLDPSASADGGIYYNFTNFGSIKCLVIEYYHVVYDDTADLVGDFEVIIFQNGTILFQYLNIQNLDSQNIFDDTPLIGLDHGDGANYNLFDEFEEEDLPITSRAISFNFDEIINHTIYPHENDEFTWIVSEVDHEFLNESVGSDWENIFGLPSDMKPLEKMKANITTIIEDSTTFKINYSLWEWIRYNETFSSSLWSKNNYTYLINPKDNPSPYNLTNNIPLFLPTPAYGYLEACDLDNQYHVYSETELLFELDWEREHDDEEDFLEARAIYNDMGILTDFDLYWFEYVASGDYWSGRSYFKMHLFYETGPKPNYVEFSEDDVLEYGVYYCPRYFPSEVSLTPDELTTTIIVNFTIEFISGEDPFLQRVAVIFDNGESPFILFIYGNLENATVDQLFDINNELLVANNTEWTIFCEKINKKYNPEFSPLSNGCIIEYGYDSIYIKTVAIYFPNGTLQSLNYYNAEGNLFMTMRYNEFDYKMYCPPIEDDDDDDEKGVEPVIPGADVAIIQFSILISIIGLIWHYRRKK